MNKNKPLDIDPRTIKALKEIANNINLLISSQEVSGEEKGEEKVEELKFNVRLANQKKKYVESEFTKTLTITWKDDKKYTEFRKWGLTANKEK